MAGCQGRVQLLVPIAERPERRDDIRPPGGVRLRGRFGPPGRGRNGFASGPLALRPHELPAERALGLEPVVGSAAQAQVVGGGETAAGDRDDVVQFQPPARLAAVAGVADERAAPAVAAEDRSADRQRDVALARMARAVRGADARRSRSRARAEAALLELVDHHVERALEDLGRLAARERVPEQVARVRQLVAEALRHREVEREADRRRGGGRRKRHHRLARFAGFGGSNRI